CCPQRAPACLSCSVARGARVWWGDRITAAGGVLTAKQAPHPPSPSPYPLPLGGGEGIYCNPLALRGGEGRVRGRHRLGARSARRTGRRRHYRADHVCKGDPMSFRSVFDSRKTRSSRTAARRTLRRRPASRLLLEALEDRTLPTFFAPVSY